MDLLKGENTLDEEPNGRGERTGLSWRIAKNEDCKMFN